MKSLFAWAPSSRSVLRIVDAVGAQARPFLEQAPPDDDGEVLVITVALEAEPHGWPGGSIRVGDLVPQNLSDSVLRHLHFTVKGRECTITMPMNKTRTEWHVNEVPTAEASRAAVRVMQMLDARVSVLTNGQQR